MNFEVEISYKANLDIRHIYEYYVMNNFDLNYVKHLINGIVSLIKSLEYLPERYPKFELLKKETNGGVTRVDATGGYSKRSKSIVYFGSIDIKLIE